MMMKEDFVKGQCRACGGHLEFPADAVGRNIPCPHCGQPTVLVAALPAPTGGRRRLWAGLAAMLCCFVGAAIVLFSRHPHPAAVSVPPPTLVASVTNIPAANESAAIPAKPPGLQPRPGETLTNNFGITGGAMGKAPGSSLVYVTGSVRNLSDHQRFGVKVDYALFDAHDRLIGHATDYQSLLEPQGDWDFKAMVMESRAVAARFNGITEQ
jgi:predicted RNA-binding Zn-ribbon protein involved in translation (DUF1610 family)